MGDWPALAALSVALPDRGAATPDQIELLLYRLQGLFLTGALDEGRALAVALRAAGLSRPALARALLGGAGSSIARAWLINGQPEAARRSLAAALALNPRAGDATLVERLRFDSESRATAGLQAKARHDLPKDKVFLDCGGYDGCSAIMFLLKNPDFDCITFEPNPALWHFYPDIPTDLQRKAVHVFDGEIDLILDPVDGDGSSIMAGKRVDPTGEIANEDCPVLTVPCVDLARVIDELAERYREIVLKLDVEGAEYGILERLLETGAIDRISKLHCEFHGHKMELEEGRHDALLERLQNRVSTASWDALPFSYDYMTNVEDEKRKRRARTVRAQLLDVLRGRLESTGR